MSGALTGIVIVDASNFVFGPVSTQLLGDMGADVIKVEPPEGDPTRGIGASRTKGMGSFFLNLNRNKRSVVLDLKSPEGARSLRELLSTADVFVHNMRSSALKNLGLTFEALHAEFPRLVHASAQGFGSGGPYFDRPAYDDVIQGLSGIAGLNAAAFGQPAYAPMLLTDKLCGVYLAQAITAALLHREREGVAQKVEVPMLETMASFNLLDHLADGVLQSSPDEVTSWRGYARVFNPSHRPLHTKDGHISIIANTDSQWRRLFELIGKPELSDDERFRTIGDRMRHVGTLYTIVEEALSEGTSQEWLEKLGAADVPCGPIHDLDALRTDPHLVQTGFFRTFSHPSEGALVMPAPPIGFSASPASVRRGPPRLGEHNAEVIDPARVPSAPGEGEIRG
ncbi:CaiB/BaiF CoA transferase family protein [Ottowia thiooxydans]|uniref:CaiB/BaiF CoA transferase family protein n=1 Tax=Ottowia thiooxydans TaxID=219182 RepID=UPI00041D3FF2|nr:CoA transferase [Ottowia thiooxydans]